AGSGFQVGDRILLQVEGDSLLSKTFAVGPGPALTLPVIGAIPLTGVRRSDIEPYLSQQLARYVKEPVVHAKALINLSILGEAESTWRILGVIVSIPVAIYGITRAF